MPMLFTQQFLAGQMLPKRLFGRKADVWVPIQFRSHLLRKITVCRTLAFGLLEQCPRDAFPTTLLPRREPSLFSSEPCVLSGGVYLLERSNEYGLIGSLFRISQSIEG